MIDETTEEYSVFFFLYQEIEWRVAVVAMDGAQKGRLSDLNYDIGRMQGAIGYRSAVR